MPPLKKVAPNLNLLLKKVATNLNLLLEKYSKILLSLKTALSTGNPGK
jgi:hypothetical protein